MADHSVRDRFPVDPIVREMMIIRLVMGLTQRDVGRVMGVGARVVSEIECGHLNTTLARARAYGRAVGMDVVLVAGGVDPNPHVDNEHETG